MTEQLTHYNYKLGLDSLRNSRSKQHSNSVNYKWDSNRSPQFYFLARPCFQLQSKGSSLRHWEARAFRFGAHIHPSVSATQRLTQRGLWIMFARIPDPNIVHLLAGSPCSPRDSQESSPTQFKSINSSALSFLYSPTLTSTHDYWKSHSLDQTDLCWHSNTVQSSAFLVARSSYFSRPYCIF